MWPGALHRFGGRTHLSEHDDHDERLPEGAPRPWLPPDGTPAAVSAPTVPVAPGAAGVPGRDQLPTAALPTIGYPHPYPPPTGPGGWGYPLLPAPAPQPPPASRRRRLLTTVAVVAAIAVAAPVVQRELLTPTTRPPRAVATGPGASDTPSAASTAGEAPTRDEQVTALLATMTKAVAAKDVAAFSGVAASGSRSARNHLREIFAGLSALPLASFELEQDTTRSSVPVRSVLPGATTLPVVATYRLRGWDGDAVQVPLQFVVAQSRGRWGIVEDRTTTDGDTARRLEPWLFPGLYVTKTKNVLVLGERTKGPQLRKLAATLERLVADVRRVWPERSWNGRVVVYAITRTPFVRSWYGRSAAGDGGNGDRASFVAKVATLERPGPGSAPGAVRMVLTPFLLKQGGRTGYEEILRHELTHVATAKINDGVPVWLVEGAAEYTGFVRRTASGALDATTTFGRHGLTKAEVTSTQRGTWRPTLTLGSDFYRGSEKKVDEAYNSAFITCLYIADRYGEKALRRLYARSAELAAKSPLADALVATTEKTALREVLRTDRARLTKEVGAFATRLRNRLVFR